MRPSDLPDFKNPPLNEVMLGIQFSPAKGYHKILAADVWRLYQDRYPFVQEQPPLAPVFETFGPGVHHQVPQFSFFSTAPHDRFWFMSNDQHRLIQFQNDRLIHNWRKLDDETHPYPRFEAMIDDYEKEMRALESYFSSISPQTLSITQCEVTYFNNIPLSSSETVGDVAKCMNFFSFLDYKPEEVNVNFRNTLTDNNGRPRARLLCDLNSVVNVSGNRALGFNLTVRGAPEKPTITSAIEFLAYAREIVVRTFARLTTESAQRQWGRI